MVKDRKELLEVARDNANQLKTNLRHAINDFLRSQQVSEEELAYVLGITNDEMNQIIRGNGNVTVDVLSKLLVATDMAVEIKPIGFTPLGAYGREMPRSGGFGGRPGAAMPMPPIGPDGRPLPPPPGFPRDGFFGRTARNNDREEVPMETNKQPRDARGRFASKRRQPAQAPTPTRQRREATNPYDSLSDDELINIIRQNIWDGEIDIDNATHRQLAEFVANKERIMRSRVNGETHEQVPMEAPVQATAPEVGQTIQGGETLNKFLQMLGNIAKEAEDNPELLDAISRFMPSK